MSKAMTTRRRPNIKGEPICRPKGRCEMKMPDGKIRKMTVWEQFWHDCRAEQLGY